MATTIDVAGVPTWFDEQGQADGAPLVLLHGGMSDSSQWGMNVGAFAAGHRVLLPDRRGHGHTADVDGPITYDLMADDTAAFVEQVVGGPAHLVGHSDGANVALLVALRHPELVDRLVLVSGNFHHDGLIPGVLDPAELGPMIEGMYAAASPDGAEHFPVVVEKVGRMWAEEPTLAVDDLAGVRARTLVVAGDDDALFLEHTIALYRGIPDSELAIVPGTSHLMLMEKPELFDELVLTFLDTDPPATFLPVRRAGA